MAIRRTRRVSHGRRKGANSRTAKRNARRGRKPRTRRHRKRTTRAPRRRSFRRSTRRYRGGIADIKDAYSGRSLADSRARITDISKHIPQPRTAKLATGPNWSVINKGLSGSHKSTTGKTPSSPHKLTKAQAKAIKNQIESSVGKGTTLTPAAIGGIATGSVVGLVITIAGVRYLLRNRAITSSMAETLIDKGGKAVQKSDNDVTFMYKGRTYRIPREDWNEVTGPTGKSLAKVESDAESWDLKGMSRVAFKFMKSKWGTGYSSETQAVDGSGKVVSTKMTFDPETDQITLSDGNGNELAYNIDDIAQELGDKFEGSTETVAQVMGRALGAKTSTSDIDPVSLRSSLENFLEKGKLVRRELGKSEGGVSDNAELEELDNAVSDALTSNAADDLGDAFDGVLGDA